MTSIALPSPAIPEPGTLTDIMAARRTKRQYEAGPVTAEALAGLLWAGQGVTAADGKRAAPSAGAICPLTLFVLARNVAGLATGLYRYRPVDQGLDEVAAALPSGMLSDAALENQPWLDLAPLVIVVAGDFDMAREHFGHQPPSGERGDRYIYMETGAVAQNIHLYATSLGLGQVLVAGFDDAAMSEKLQLPEGLNPVALLCLGQAG